MTRRLSKAEILAQIPAARARVEARHAVGLYAKSVRYDAKGQRILLELGSGHLFGIPVASLPHIANASSAQLARVETMPTGSAIRFPDLDADYSVPGLVLAIGAQESGRRGGRVRSEAKAQSSKANGAKGGRPRKVASAEK